ncbi:ClpX, ATPase regulatory subunit [Microthyrium microscopicum]|uniref:ClpX, ATPase regulatory subunit n=1 Tax=Microthyrium microscopicum TaxID=703497 RepID=A0A6A6UHI3_9PEZI|nr:ClpX, ATPase regulatory subunit [Microthyrium microscopicum]
MRPRASPLSFLRPSRSNLPRSKWHPARRTRRFSTPTPRRSSGQFNRSDFGNQPFSGIYEPGGPTQGPLGGASNIGAPKITPKKLKQHLDEFVVGQERAKKVLSTAVYNHYQRIEELQRQQREYEKAEERRARVELSNRHPVEDEFPGQQATPRSHTVPPQQPLGKEATLSEMHDDPPSISLEKSNILLLGPSGVGKTLMAKTLARVLDVPFSMSDCTPLTQAGYIGEDAEVVVQRLLSAANYDIAKAETGIICLDEIDKIASAKVSHGKDVSGEGVQQALLKIIEGTTVTVQAKNEKTSPATGRERDRNSGSPPNTFPQSPPSSGPSGGKNEVYTVRTDNILFICTGAFIGLHKLVMERIAKGSIGFNAPVRASADPNKGSHDTTIKVDRSNAHLFKDHIPFWHSPSETTPYAHSSNAPLPRKTEPEDDPNLLNTLDLITPSDLQKFGLIPELIGRIPVHCAVSPLSERALVRVLTEPRNALLKQYQSLFNLSGIELRFTTAAIRAIASKASGLGTGARGLRGVLEQVLAESMFEAPGSGTKYVLVTKEVVERRAAPVHLARGQGQLFASLAAQEEEREGDGESGDGAVSNFQEYRKKVSAAGQ